jgi:hypothetical protein
VLSGGYTELLVGQCGGARAGTSGGVLGHGMPRGLMNVSTLFDLKNRGSRNQYFTAKNTYVVVF